MIFGDETSTFVFPSTTIIWTPHFAICLQYSSQEKTHEDSDYTAMITIVPWSLHAKTHPGGEVVSDAITFVFVLATIAC